MNKNPEVLLSTLKKGDCFMFMYEPYIVNRIYWEKIGLFKRKVWVCTNKFDDDKNWHYLGDTEVYQISKGLYDLIEFL